MKVLLFIFFNLKNGIFYDSTCSEPEWNNQHNRNTISKNKEERAINWMYCEMLYKEMEFEQ
jgi:hypothetical protein